MNEIPSPAAPAPLYSGPRRDSQASTPAYGLPLASVGAEARSGIAVSWATSSDEVRASQRLRFNVFSGEMGARLDTTLPDHDVDLFDDYCEHLLA